MALKDKPSKRGVALDEDGGETVSIIILVNGVKRYVRHATITGNPDPGKDRGYKTDTNVQVKNKREGGFLSLVKKILNL